MNSPIKLPPLPYPQMPGNDYTAADMRAYAEQAVREALAAQVTVAWMTEDGRVATDETKRTGMASSSKVNFCIPLAAIPENNQPIECGACAGMGRVVRDPNIGTDQECWVCDGSGQTNE